MAAAESARGSKDIVINEPLTQAGLKKLAASKKGQNATSLSISPDYNDNLPVIDMGAVAFPNLRTLTLISQPLKAWNFKAEGFPVLEELSIDSPSDEPGFVDFHMPSLKTMNVQFVQSIKDPSGLGKSLSRCIQLKHFFSYKLWRLEILECALPACVDLQLIRSEGLFRLDLWAPKLGHLEIDSCYELEHVNILDIPPEKYHGPEYLFRGEPTPYFVSMSNINRPKGNLLTHSRCGAYSPQ